MSNPNSLPECHTCLYFQHIQNAIGNCHLNPPIPTKPKKTSSELSDLPITWETNYCSHHKSKDNK